MVGIEGVEVGLSFTAMLGMTVGAAVEVEA